MKIIDLRDFIRIVHNFEILPNAVTPLFAAILPIVELFFGLFLILNISVKNSARILSFLVIIFLIAIGINLQRGVLINCGCFGDIFGQKLGWVILLRNIVLFILLILLSFSEKYFLYQKNISQKNTLINKLYIILLIISVTISISGKVSFKDNNMAPGFSYVENSDSLAKILITHWKELPLISGKINNEFWKSTTIVGVIFSMKDCDFCLPKTDEFIEFVDSLRINTQISLLSIGITNESFLLKRYLKVVPKPCPVFIMKDREGDTYIDTTPCVFIIKRNENVKLYKGRVQTNSYSKEYYDKIKTLISSE